MKIKLSEYAERLGKNKGNARTMAVAGRFKTAEKRLDGYHWFIDEDEPWPDKRLKSGKYAGWRKRAKKQKEKEE